MFIIERCKREEYIKAWNHMYLSEKDKFNKNPIFDGINPSLNKTPLGSETDNFCTVAYDDQIPTEGFKYGKPVGLFSFVVTPAKVIGKQYIVHPDYQGKGLGKALLIENEKTLIENGHSKYYIGCSICSASILQKYWGAEPFNSNVEKDLYKFNIDLARENFDSLYSQIITNNKSIMVVGGNAGSVDQEAFIEEARTKDAVNAAIEAVDAQTDNVDACESMEQIASVVESIQPIIGKNEVNFNIEKCLVKDAEIDKAEKLAIERLASVMVDASMAVGNGKKSKAKSDKFKKSDKAEKVTKTKKKSGTSSKSK